MHYCVLFAKSRQIAQTHLYTKTAQSGYEQGISIAEEMLGCNNIFALCCQRHEGVADEIDPELLAKVLANPEMRALLNSLAKTMK